MDFVIIVYNLYYTKSQDSMNQKYLDEEKHTIIERYKVYGERSSQIISNIGIAQSTFYEWLNEYRKD